MRPVSSLRFALFAAAVLSVLALQARAAPEKEPTKEPPPKKADEAPKGGAVPLNELTQEKLRQAAAEDIKASRANPPVDGPFWKELDGLVEIDPESILYEHQKGTPLNVTWDAKPTHALSEAERAKAQEDLHKIFDHILFGQSLGGGTEPAVGGLLSKDDAKAVLAVTHLNVGPKANPEPQPEPKPEPKPEPVKPPMTPTAENGDEVARLRRELDDTRRELNKLRQDVDEKRRLEQEEKRQKELEATRLQLEKLRFDLDDLRAQGDKREKDLDAARAEADKRQKDLDETRLQLEKLRLELDDLRKLRDKDLDDLRREEERRQKGTGGGAGRGGAAAKGAGGHAYTGGQAASGPGRPAPRGRKAGPDAGRTQARK